MMIVSTDLPLYWRSLYICKIQNNKDKQVLSVISITSWRLGRVHYDNNRRLSSGHACAVSNNRPEGRLWPISPVTGPQQTPPEVRQQQTVHGSHL